MVLNIIVGFPKPLVNVSLDCLRDVNFGYNEEIIPFLALLNIFFQKNVSLGWADEKDVKFFLIENHIIEIVKMLIFI